MIEVQRRQRQFRLPLTEDIEPDLRSRDDIRKTLQGIRDLCSDPDFRKPVFMLPDETLLPDADRHQVRPGMDLRTILAPGIVKQAKRMDFGTLRNQANNHEKFRLFLWTADLRDDRECSLEALERNIDRPRPNFSKRSASRSRARSRESRLAACKTRADALAKLPARWRRPGWPNGRSGSSSAPSGARGS